MTTGTDPDIHWTRRALELAALGIGLASPNPLVGCVIVSAEGEAIGEGTYYYDDITHAEVIALEHAGTAARGGTAYVSLEPHAHHGKTAPCTDALIRAGISRIVCPIEDPNPLVSGTGFETLRKAGIEVVTGILAKEASALNEKFICWHTRSRPFVHLKLASSIDGRISLSDSVSTSLSGDQALHYVHALRHEYDAILVGSNTVCIDNPRLTDRSGSRRRRPLVRVVLDNQLRTPLESAVLKTASDTPTIIYTNSKDRDSIERFRQFGVEVVVLETGSRDICAVLADLASREIQSVLVEGGSEIAGSFNDGRLVDKYTFLISPVIIGGPSAPVAIGGIGADALNGTLRLSDISVRTHGDDIEITGYPSDV